MTSNPDGFELSKRRKTLSILATLLFLGAGGAVASETSTTKPIKKKKFVQNGVSSCLVYSYHGLSGSYTKQEYMQALDASITALANSANDKGPEASDLIAKHVLILRALHANLDT